MNTEELKSLIKEVVQQLITEEVDETKKKNWLQKAIEPKRVKKTGLEEGEYDPQSDTMAYEPRDRIPGDEGPDRLTQAMQKLNMVASRLRVLVEVCRKNNLPNLAKQTEEMMYDIFKFTNSK
jgi:hypothetical protein